MTEHLIPVPPDYDFALNYEFLRRSPKEILHVVEGENVYKALKAGRKKYLFALTPTGRNFRITYLNNSPDEKTHQYIVNYVREWFDLETDLTPFYELAGKDKLLKDVVAKYKGYRIIGQPDLFESLVWAIIGQQINLGFAYTLKQRFVETFGESVELNKKLFYLFPAPSVAALLTENDLLPLQFSRQKAKYIRTIAEEFCANSISREIIGRLSFHEARQKLMSVKGVGNWTANYALMKTFRYPEAFPLEDAGLHNAIRSLKKLTEKPTIEEVKRIFKKYKGWEAYATLYLWKTL